MSHYFILPYMVGFRLWARFAVWCMIFHFEATIRKYFLGLVLLQSDTSLRDVCCRFLPIVLETPTGLYLLPINQIKGDIP